MIQLSKKNLNVLVENLDTCQLKSFQSYFIIKSQCIELIQLSEKNVYLYNIKINANFYFSNNDY